MVDKFLLIQVLRSLIFSFKRVLIAFISIFIAAMICAAFLNIYFDIDIKLSKELQSYGANFSVGAKNGKIKLKELEKIKKALNTSAFTPYLYGFYNLGSTAAVVLGTDLKSLKLTRPTIETMSGSFNISDFTANNAFIGEDLAKNMELKVGESIKIYNSSNSKMKEVRIKAIVKSGDELDGVLLIPLEIALYLSDEDYVNYALAIVQGDFDTLLKRASYINTDEINARPIASVSLSEGVLLSKMELLMAFISIVILSITSLSVETTLSSIILARKREIALALAIGATKRAIIKLFVLELLILSLAASITGALAGYFLANLLGYMIFDSSIDFRLISFIIALILSLIFVVLASLIPLKSIFEINICKNLKAE